MAADIVKDFLICGRKIFLMLLAVSRFFGDVSVFIDDGKGVLPAVGMHTGIEGVHALYYAIENI